MSQHEYGYGPPDSYYPPHPNSNQAFTSCLAPTNGSNASQPYLPSNAHQSPVEYSHNVIPGLGLSPSNNSATWLSQSPHAARQAPAHSQQMSDSQDRGRKAVATLGPAISSSGHLPAVEASNVEEGELSEGELEDIYEPPESGFQEIDSTMAHIPKTSSASTTYVHDSTGIFIAS
jgi:hypothetical protein